MGNLSLPSVSTPFINRDTELAQLRQWLTDHTCCLISLVGLGGIGKTRLSIETARQNIDLFPGGVFFVRLQPLELPDLILPAIAESAHMIASPGVELEQQMAEFLGGKRRLLVLDSFEHLLPDVEVVIDLLQLAPEVKLLITSREKLNIQDEAVLHVGPLTYPEQDTADAEQYASVSMFLSLLHRLEPELPISPDMLADVCRICRQVQGWPLAIQLAVGWADTLSLREIAQEIARNIDFLETTKHDVLDRHRNIRAVLEPSLQTLPDTARTVMEKLCVFRGNFTREAAEAVAGASLPSLGLLVSKSLVRRRTSGGYGIHELVRQYGEARLSNMPGQREAAEDRFTDYYAAFLETQWQGMKSALRSMSFERMDAELANSLDAFQTMAENSNTAQIWQSMNALWGYFALRSRFNEGAVIFGKSVEALRTGENEALIGSLLLRQSFFLAFQGRPEDSDKTERLAEEGLMLLVRHQSYVPREVLIVGYFCAGIIHWFLGKSQRMKDAAQSGLDYAVEADDLFGIRLTMCLLGRAEFKLGNYARAREIGQACYEQAYEQGDFLIQGITAFNVLAEVAFVQNEYEEARRWCQIAQQCFEDMLEPWTLATTMLLTVCAVALKDFNEARNQFDVCLRLLEENGMVSQIPAIMLRVARLLAGQQMIEYAVALLPLVIDHPACRKVTYDEATSLLSQLASVRPETSSLPTRIFAQDIQLTQARKFLAYIKSAIGRPSVGGVLSERELDVLRLMADGMSNAEIAQRLHVTVGTVKTHNKSIFGKLGVNRRTQAVARARQLGIL